MNKTVRFCSHKAHILTLFVIKKLETIYTYIYKGLIKQIMVQTYNAKILQQPLPTTLK